MRAQSPLLDDANHDLENNEWRNVLSGPFLKVITKQLTVPSISVKSKYTGAHKGSINVLTSSVQVKVVSIFLAFIDV